MKVGGVIMRPRPAPGRMLPTIAAGTVVLLALPIFAIARWSIAAWGLAAVLWVASALFAVMLQRLKLGAAHLASSGVIAFGMMFRAIAVMIVLVAVAASNQSVGLPAALLFAVVYTFELGLGLLSYFGGDA